MEIYRRCFLYQLSACYQTSKQRWSCPACLQICVALKYDIYIYIYLFIYLYLYLYWYLPIHICILLHIYIRYTRKTMSSPTNTGIISSTVPLFLVTSPLVTSSIECHQHWPYFHLSIIKKGKRTAVARPSVLNFRSSRMFEYIEESVAASQKHTPPLAACGKGLRNMFTDCKPAMTLYSRQKKNTTQLKTACFSPLFCWTAGLLLTISKNACQQGPS